MASGVYARPVECAGINPSTTVSCSASFGCCGSRTSMVSECGASWQCLVALALRRRGWIEARGFSQGLS